MPRYELQIFNSRNTAAVDYPEFTDAEAAKRIARDISKDNAHPVVISDEHRETFVKYEHGEATEWSTKPLK